MCSNLPGTFGQCIEGSVFVRWFAGTFFVVVKMLAKNALFGYTLERDALMRAVLLDSLQIVMGFQCPFFA